MSFQTDSITGMEKRRAGGYELAPTQWVVFNPHGAPVARIRPFGSWGFSTTMDHQVYHSLAEAFDGVIAADRRRSAT